MEEVMDKISQLLLRKYGIDELIVFIIGYYAFHMENTSIHD